jgi:hypothetical protein
MKETTRPPTDGTVVMKRFEELTRRLLAVPKAELLKLERVYKAARKRKK